MLTLKSPAEGAASQRAPPLRQCNSNTSAHLECSAQSGAAAAAQPPRGNARHHMQTSVGHEQQQSLLEGRATEENPQAHPQLNKSRSPINVSLFNAASEDAEKAETIHNLRKSFASLFSE